MPLEDEINARLRRLSEEIRNSRKDIVELARRDRRPPSRDEVPAVKSRGDAGSPESSEE